MIQTHLFYLNIFKNKKYTSTYLYGYMVLELLNRTSICRMFMHKVADANIIIVSFIRYSGDNYYFFNSDLSRPELSTQNPVSFVLQVYYERNQM